MNMNKCKILFAILIAISPLFLVKPISVIAETTTTSSQTEREYVGENFCSEESVKNLLKLAGYIVIIAKVAVPLIIIVIGTFDLFKAVIGKDEKILQKSAKSLALRVVLGVFIFFIPSLVNWTFDLFYEESNTTSNKQCIDCVLSPNDC